VQQTYGTPLANAGDGRPAVCPLVQFEQVDAGPGTGRQVRIQGIGTGRNGKTATRERKEGVEETPLDPKTVLRHALLNQKNRVVGVNTVSIGSLTASVVHPREVFKPAILSNAAAIILAHNHPSGQPQPSQEDRVLTVRLVAAGKLLGISVLDHVVIGDGTSAYFSFADEGLLDRC